MLEYTEWDRYNWPTKIVVYKLLRSESSNAGLVQAYRRRRAWGIRALWVVLPCVLVNAPLQLIYAQACSGIPGLLVNGGFELPDIDNASPAAVQVFGSPPLQVKIYNENDVIGWETTAADNRIELWQSNFNGVASYEGVQHAEINANLFGAFFQDLATEPSAEVLWSFAHRGRSGVDQVRVLIGPPGGPLISQGTFSTGNANWDVKSGVYIVPAGQTTTRFQFLAVSTASGNSSVGNFVDDVRIRPNCDYGDAPGSYAVTRSNNGAAHRVLSAAFLGNLIDSEIDGQPSNATADDLTNSDDEDGVIYGHMPFGTLLVGIPNVVSVTASMSGFVSLWIDLNGDGAWQATERVMQDRAVIAGAQQLVFDVPDSATSGATYARIRFTTDDPQGTLNVFGDWENGEVEDDAVTLQASPMPLLDIEKEVSVISDPITQTISPKSVPGAIVSYAIVATNTTIGSNDRNSLVIVDDLPTDIDFFSGNLDGTGSPFIFTQGIPSSGIQLNFNSLSDTNDDIVFLDSNNIEIIPNGDFDSRVRSIRFEFDEQFQLPNSSFRIEFQARVK